MPDVVSVDHRGEGICVNADPEARWYVLHTKSRQEKVVAASLHAVGVAHFLPLVRHQRFYGRRKFTVDLPLFPSYIFLYGNVVQAYDVDRNGRLARIIRVADQKQLDWELRNVHLAMQQQATLDPYPYLNQGMRAEVRSGPFRGLQGLIEDRVKVDRLVLQVDVLGLATSVEIDASLLDPIDS